jgi:hypothetical protein
MRTGIGEAAGHASFADSHSEEEAVHRTRTRRRDKDGRKMRYLIPLRKFSSGRG